MHRTRRKKSCCFACCCDGFFGASPTKGARGESACFFSSPLFQPTKKNTTPHSLSSPHPLPLSLSTRVGGWVEAFLLFRRGVFYKAEAGMGKGNAAGCLSETAGVTLPLEQAQHVTLLVWWGGWVGGWVGKGEGERGWEDKAYDKEEKRKPAATYLTHGALHVPPDGAGRVVQELHAHLW